MEKALGVVLAKSRAVEMGKYQQQRGFRHLRGPHDSNRHGRSPSWVFGRRGREAF